MEVFLRCEVERRPDSAEGSFFVFVFDALPLTFLGALFPWWIEQACSDFWFERLSVEKRVFAL